MINNYSELKDYITCPQKFTFRCIHCLGPLKSIYPDQHYSILKSRTSTDYNNRTNILISNNQPQLYLYATPNCAYS